MLTERTFAPVVLAAALFSGGLAPARVVAEPTKPSASGGAAKPVTLTIKGPPARLVLVHNRETSLAVSTGEVPVNNLRIALSNLQDASTGALLPPEALALCLGTVTSCAEPLNIAANRTERVLLKVARQFETNGVFTGSVSLTADGKVGVESFDLTVLSTSRSSQFLGAVALAAGIGLSWFMLVWLRQRAFRAEALMPVAQLGDVLTELEAEVERAFRLTRRKLEGLEGQLKALRNAMKPSQLESLGYLPWTIPNPFKQAPDRSGEYKQFLTEQSRKVMCVAVIVRDGVKAALAMVPQAGTDGNVYLVAALAQLDAQAGVDTVDAARVLVGKTLEELRDKLRPPKPPAAAAPRDAGPVPSVAELRGQLRELSATVWVFWGMLTLLTGIIALIATNNGFGAGLDFYKCFLWGLGVQVAGQSLQQLAPTAISTAFSISFPK
jgi:hypothetical protein